MCLIRAADYGHLGILVTKPSTCTGSSGNWLEMLRLGSSTMSMDSHSITQRAISGPQLRPGMAATAELHIKTPVDTAACAGTRRGVGGWHKSKTTECIRTLACTETSSRPRSRTIWPPSNYTENSLLQT